MFTQYYRYHTMTEELRTRRGKVVRLRNSLALCECRRFGLEDILCSINFLKCANEMPPSTDMQAFREILAKSKHVVILTGAGVSAESGVPTFRGAGGFWRKYQAQNLASPIAFQKNPGLVWEFYHYRRELVLTKKPNAAHYAIADFEKRSSQDGRKVVLITQNVDELHKTAGSKDIIELHGSLFKTICLKCGHREENYESPICEGLRGKGAPDPDAVDSLISENDLPKCKNNGCNGLLRPDIVWFGESLKEEDLANAGDQMDKCDLCLVVGTSSVVYPAAMFAPQAASRGVPVAEFNLEQTSCTDGFNFYFEGPCGETIPKALGTQ